MGNRAVIAFSRAKNSPVIYLHWNGGRASVEGFLSGARDVELTGANDRERMDTFAEIIAAALHAAVNINTVYRETYARADVDNWDNGLFLISREWEILGRDFMRHAEEINPAKTAEIRDAFVAAAADRHHVITRA